MKLPTNALLAILLLAYPVIVYFGLQYVEPSILAMLLGAMIALRFWLSRSFLTKMPWLKLATILGLAVVLASVFMNSEIGVLLYPVAISSSMLAIFAYSLYNKPSVIETFARISEPDLDQRGVRYTEKVTAVWCGFFIINIGISLYTVFYSSREIWTLYNGLISYCLIGAIFAVEFVVRKIVKKRGEPSEHQL